MDDDPPFTVRGFIGGLALGGLIATSLCLLTFGLLGLLDGSDNPGSGPAAGNVAFPLVQASPASPTPSPPPRTATAPPPRSTVDAAPPRTATATTRPGATSTASPAATPTTTATATATPEATPTPTPPAAAATATPKPGPPDLAMQQVSILPGGKVRAVITNLGQSDVVDRAIVVVFSDATTRSEFVQAGTRLAVGASLQVDTQQFTLTQATSVTATVDPSASIEDRDRSNNSMTSPLTP